MTLGIRKDGESTLSELRKAHQEACNALLRMRLEGRDEAALAQAMQHAQNTLNALFAARLDEEEATAAAPAPPPKAHSPRPARLSA
jgi:hypothetical protein